MKDKSIYFNTKTEKKQMFSVNFLDTDTGFEFDGIVVHQRLTKK